MLPIIEPIEAGLIVALINKLIINNHRLWEFWRGVPKPEQKQEHEDTKDASSSTTSINDVEVHMHHF